MSATDQQFKADAGKAKPDLFALGFANAVRIVQATMEYGSIKYEEHSWRHVPDGLRRYTRAAGRHRQDRERDYLDMGADNIILSLDPESGLPHIAHEIFNLCAMFELKLAEEARANGMSAKHLCDHMVGQMLEPPTGHKESPATTSEPEGSNTPLTALQMKQQEEELAMAHLLSGRMPPPPPRDYAKEGVDREAMAMMLQDVRKKPQPDGQYMSDEYLTGMSYPNGA